MSPSRYVPNRPAVIDETIDGEVVVIDLATGNYFSLVESAAVIWGALAGMPSVEEIGAELARVFDVDATRAARVAEDFVAELVREGLAVETDEAPAADGGRPRPSQTVAAERKPFEAPRLEKYDDMQELILLDPVHDVDVEAGWPRPRAVD
jgi:hypothetical protein